MIDLEAIKGRLAAATPGPWYVDESLRGVEAQTHGYPVEIVAWTGRADAVLIAHAPGDIAALVAEVERLRADNARIMLEAERHRRIADEAVERIESAETERAAVLSWLHRMERNARHWGGKDDERADIYARLADVFECGEHLDEYFGKKEQ
jgi:hypothetical protein